MTEDDHYLELVKYQIRVQMEQELRRTRRVILGFVAVAVWGFVMAFFSASWFLHGGGSWLLIPITINFVYAVVSVFRAETMFLERQYQKRVRKWLG